MSLPDVSETVTDGALGATAGSADNVVLLAGVSTLGTPATLYPLTDPNDVASTLGYGPLAEQAANCLARGGGKVTVLALPITSSAGTIGSVTHTGSGAATVVDNASAPNDAIDLVIKVTTAGVLTTWTYQYSVDGGKSYNGADIVSAATITIPNTGLALTLSGTAVKGDTYAFSSTAPSYSTSAFNTAMAAALLTPSMWSLCHVIGTPASEAACATMFAAVDTKVQAAVATHRPFRAFVDGPGGTVVDATLIAAFASTTSAQGRCGVVAGEEQLASSITGKVQRRPAAWSVVARVIAKDIQEDAGRVASGPLAGVGKLVSDTSDLPVSWAFRDERRTPGLDAAGFTTLRTYLGLNGTYCTQATMLAPVGSDFSLLQYGRVMDKALTVGHAAMLQYENETLRVNAAGQIDERDAAHVESNVLAILKSQLGGAVSDITFVVNRTDNILSTKTLRYKVRIRPLGYAKFITGEYGFINPALAA